MYGALKSSSAPSFIECWGGGAPQRPQLCYVEVRTAPVSLLDQRNTATLICRPGETARQAYLVGY